MTDRILVINPNSTQAVTDNISAALDGLRFANGPRIDCATLAEGPPGVESQRDADGVIGPLCKLIEREPAAAHVIACFSDPGLYSAREVTASPVFGIAQSGFATALTVGERFGVISILSKSIPRHLRYVASLGLTARLAGDRAIEMGVVELQQEDKVMQRMTEVGEQLKRDDGADVLVLGCAGMARYRADLEDRLGLPVIDPTQAAAGQALTALSVARSRTAPAHAAE